MDTFTIHNLHAEQSPIDSNLDRRYYEITKQFKKDEEKEVKLVKSKIQPGVSSLSRKKSLNAKNDKKRLVFNWKFEMKKPNEHFQLTPVINSMEKKLKRLINLRDKMKADSRKAVNVERAKKIDSPTCINRSSRCLWTINKDLRSSKSISDDRNNFSFLKMNKNTLSPVKVSKIPSPKVSKENKNNLLASSKSNYLLAPKDRKYNSSSLDESKTLSPEQSNKTNELFLKKAEHFNRMVFKEIGSKREGNKLVNELCRVVQLHNTSDVPHVDKKKQIRQTKYYMNKSMELLKDMKITIIQTAVAKNRFDNFDNKVAKTKEFISRFLRLYTYPLLQHVSEVEACGEPEKNPVTYLKLTNMYKIVYTALDACNKNIPSIVGVNFKDKLKEFLDCIVQICDMNTKYIELKHLLSYGTLVKDLKDLCEEQLKKLDENISIPSVDSVMKVIKYKKPLKVNKYNIQRGRKKPVKNHTAYYTPSPWKQKLNKKKPRVPRKEGHRLDDPKTMTFLRNLPIVIANNQAKYQEVLAQATQITNVIKKEKKKVKKRKSQKKARITNKKEQTSKEEAIRKYLEIVQDTYEKTEYPDSQLINTIMLLEKCLNLDLYKKMTNIYDPCQFTAPPNSPKQPSTPIVEEEKLSGRKLKLYVRK